MRICKSPPSLARKLTFRGAVGGAAGAGGRKRPLPPSPPSKPTKASSSLSAGRRADGKEAATATAAAAAAEKRGGVKVVGEDVGVAGGSASVGGGSTASASTPSSFCVPPPFCNDAHRGAGGRATHAHAAPPAAVVTSPSPTRTKTRTLTTKKTATATTTATTTAKAIETATRTVRTKTATKTTTTVASRPLIGSRWNAVKKKKGPDDATRTANEGKTRNSKTTDATDQSPRGGVPRPRPRPRPMPIAPSRRAATAPARGGGGGGGGPPRASKGVLPATSAAAARGAPRPGPATRGAATGPRPAARESDVVGGGSTRSPHIASPGVGAAVAAAAASAVDHERMSQQQHHHHHQHQQHQHSRSGADGEDVVPLLYDYWQCHVVPHRERSFSLRQSSPRTLADVGDGGITTKRLADTDNDNSGNRTTVMMTNKKIVPAASRISVASSSTTATATVMVGNIADAAEKRRAEMTQRRIVKSKSDKDYSNGDEDQENVLEESKEAAAVVGPTATSTSPIASPRRPSLSDPYPYWEWPTSNDPVFAKGAMDRDEAKYWGAMGGIGVRAVLFGKGAGKGIEGMVSTLSSSSVAASYSWLQTHQHQRMQPDGNEHHHHRFVVVRGTEKSARSSSSSPSTFPSPSSSLHQNEHRRRRAHSAALAAQRKMMEQRQAQRQKKGRGSGSGRRSAATMPLPSSPSSTGSGSAGSTAKNTALWNIPEDKITLTLLPPPPTLHPYHNSHPRSSISSLSASIATPAQNGDGTAVAVDPLLLSAPTPPSPSSSSLDGTPPLEGLSSSSSFADEEEAEAEAVVPFVEDSMRRNRPDADQPNDPGEHGAILEEEEQALEGGDGMVDDDDHRKKGGETAAAVEGRKTIVGTPTARSSRSLPTAASSSSPLPTPASSLLPHLASTAAAMAVSTTAAVAAAPSISPSPAPSPAASESEEHVCFARQGPPASYERAFAAAAKAVASAAPFSSAFATVTDSGLRGGGVGGGRRRRSTVGPMDDADAGAEAEAEDRRIVGKDSYDDEGEDEEDDCAAPRGFVDPAVFRAVLRSKLAASTMRSDWDARRRRGGDDDDGGCGGGGRRPRPVSAPMARRRCIVEEICIPDDATDVTGDVTIPVCIRDELDWEMERRKIGLPIHIEVGFGAGGGWVSDGGGAGGAAGSTRRMVAATADQSGRISALTGFGDDEYCYGNYDDGEVYADADADAEPSPVGPSAAELPLWGEAGEKENDRWNVGDTGADVDVVGDEGNDRGQSDNAGGKEDEEESKREEGNIADGVLVECGKEGAAVNSDGGAANEDAKGSDEMAIVVSGSPLSDGGERPGQGEQKKVDNGEARPERSEKSTNDCGEEEAANATKLAEEDLAAEFAASISAPASALDLSMSAPPYSTPADAETDTDASGAWRTFGRSDSCRPLAASECEAKFRGHASAVSAALEAQMQPLSLSRPLSGSSEKEEPKTVEAEVYGAAAAAENSGAVGGAFAVERGEEEKEETYDNVAVASKWHEAVSLGVPATFGPAGGGVGGVVVDSAVPLIRDSVASYGNDENGNDICSGDGARSLEIALGLPGDKDEWKQDEKEEAVEEDDDVPKLIKAAAASAAAVTCSSPPDDDARDTENDGVAAREGEEKYSNALPTPSLPPAVAVLATLLMQKDEKEDKAYEEEREEELADADVRRLLGMVPHSPTVAFHRKDTTVKGGDVRVEAHDDDAEEGVVDVGPGADAQHRKGEVAAAASDNEIDPCPRPPTHEEMHGGSVFAALASGDLSFSSASTSGDERSDAEEEEEELQRRAVAILETVDERHELNPCGTSGGSLEPMDEAEASVKTYADPLIKGMPWAQYIAPTAASSSQYSASTSTPTLSASYAIPSRLDADTVSISSGRSGRFSHVSTSHLSQASSARIIAVLGAVADSESDDGDSLIFEDAQIEEDDFDAAEDDGRSGDSLSGGGETFDHLDDGGSEPATPTVLVDHISKLLGRSKAGEISTPKQEAISEENVEDQHQDPEEIEEGESEQVQDPSEAQFQTSSSDVLVVSPSYFTKCIQSGSPSENDNSSDSIASPSASPAHHAPESDAYRTSSHKKVKWIDFGESPLPGYPPTPQHKRGGSVLSGCSSGARTAETESVTRPSEDEGSHASAASRSNGSSPKSPPMSPSSARSASSLSRPAHLAHLAQEGRIRSSIQFLENSYSEDDCNDERSNSSSLNSSGIFSDSEGAMVSDMILKLKQESARRRARLSQLDGGGVQDKKSVGATCDASDRPRLDRMGSF